jgi:hypothetical protein
MGSFDFVVLGKAAKASQLGERAFDNPAFGKEVKAWSDPGNDSGFQIAGKVLRVRVAMTRLARAKRVWSGYGGDTVEAAEVARAAHDHPGGFDQHAAQASVGCLKQASMIGGYARGLGCWEPMRRRNRCAINGSVPEAASNRFLNEHRLVLRSEFAIHGLSNKRLGRCRQRADRTHPAPASPPPPHQAARVRLTAIILEPVQKVRLAKK